MLDSTLAYQPLPPLRDKFPHILDAELDSRRAFVEELHHVVGDIKSCADSESVRRKLEREGAHSKQDLLNDSLSQMSNSRNPTERNNTRFIKEQRLEAASMIGHQDEAIDSLGNAVDRLGQLGKEVNVELKEQNIMLAGLEDDIDEAGNRMNMVMASLAKLLKTKDGCMIWTIVILFLVLVLLIALVIVSLASEIEREKKAARISRLVRSLTRSFLLPSSLPLSLPTVDVRPNQTRPLFYFFNIFRCLTSL